MLAMNARLLALGAGDQNAIPNHTYTAVFQVPDTRFGKNTLLSPKQPFAHLFASRPSYPSMSVVPQTALTILSSHTLNFTTQPIDWQLGAVVVMGGGYRTKVVDINTVYNSFGDGAVHPQAIKAFLKHAYQNWAPPALSYVVLFGDGTIRLPRHRYRDLP